jgi:hypothetical protein
MVALFCHDRSRGRKHHCVRDGPELGCGTPTAYSRRPEFVLISASGAISRASGRQVPVSPHALRSSNGSVLAEGKKERIELWSCRLKRVGKRGPRTAPGTTAPDRSAPDLGEGRRRVVVSSECDRLGGRRRGARPQICLTGRFACRLRSRSNEGYCEEPAFQAVRK